MNDFIANIDWSAFMEAIWTIILVPVLTWAGKQLHDWAKSKKLDKYTDMLYDAVTAVVKDIYQTIVQEIKGGDQWTDEKKAEVFELAKSKIIAALSTDGYKFLKTVNTDFDDWMGSLIESALYDLKKEHQK